MDTNTNVNQTQNTQNQQNVQTQKKPTIQPDSVKIGKTVEKDTQQYINKVNVSGDKNEKYVSTHKQELTTRSYANQSYNMLPYNNFKHAQILSTLDSVKNSINGITLQVLESVNTKQDAYNKILSSLKGGTVALTGGGENGTNATASTQIMNFFKVGNTGGGQLITLSNSSLEEFVKNEVIPFTEHYYSNFSKSLQNSCKSVGETWDNKVDAIISSINQSNNIPKGNVNQALKWCGNAIIDLIRGVFDAVSHRNNDYLKLLSEVRLKTKDQPSVNPQNQQAGAVLNNNIGTVQQQQQAPTPANI